jgi:hypothetical protein
VTGQPTSVTVDGALVCGVNGTLTDEDIANLREVFAAAERYVEKNVDVAKMAEKQQIARERMRRRREHRS